MLYFGPGMLEDGTNLDFEADILKFLVFNKLTSIVRKFYDEMKGAVTKFNTAAYFFFSFINNLANFEGFFQKIKNGIHIIFKKCYNTNTEDIGDFFQASIFIFIHNLISKCFFRFDSDGHVGNFNVIHFQQGIDYVVHIVGKFFINVNILIIFGHNRW